jgi:hypothetical protein
MELLLLNHISKYLSIGIDLSPCDLVEDIWKVNTTW